MKTLAVRRRASLRDALRQAVALDEPLFKTDHKLLAAYQAAKRRFDDIAGGLAQLCRRYCAFGFDPPVLELVGAEVAALPYSEALATVNQRLDAGIDALCQRLSVPQLGRIEWLDDESCKFTYFHIQRTDGIV